MKHTKNLSIVRPASASLLETQQKVNLGSAIISAFTDLAGALGAWRGLFGNR